MKIQKNLLYFGTAINQNAKCFSQSAPGGMTLTDLETKVNCMLLGDPNYDFEINYVRSEEFDKICL